MRKRHTPFLKQVANYYKDTESLADYCFVFPNRRSGQFFAMYLDEMRINADRPVVMQPSITTISDFVSELSNETTPNVIQSLFLLYKAYRSINPNEDYPFDKFVYWGNVVLSDFNDVDMYLVDPKEIFNNIRDYREISTDFLPKELKQELSRYLNFNSNSDDNDRFWKHISENSDDDENGEVKKSYMRLWQQLLPLYEAFNLELEKSGLSYTGKTYRDAAKAVIEGGESVLNYKRYVFVGFNVLSNCELSIFNSLHKAKIADFFWDHDWPAMDNTNNLATKFIRFYSKRFPEPHDFISDHLEANEWPEISTIAIPSNFGQTKYAFTIVDQLIKNGHTNAGNAINTAIVLPDENLFTPLINSVSPRVRNVNVTIGYPLRSADIVSLMHTVAKMHRQASRCGDQWRFYREDVRGVLSHPIVKSAFALDALKIAQVIDNINDFNVPENLIDNDNSLKPLFNTISSNSSVGEVSAYLDKLIEFVSNLSNSISGGASQNDEDATEASIPLQSAFINQYMLIMQQVKNCIETFGIPQCESTIFYLTDRLTGSYTIPFEGEPLNGLQVMGMLETRCLDFDNVILLSMNERIFPRKYHSRSLIADSLRHHFGMASTEHKEAMTSYYFYRLLARAQRVYMLYSTQQQGIGSSEPSRYIAQLKKIYNLPIKHVAVNSKLVPSCDYVINLSKDDYCMRKIAKYQSDDTETGYLSASSINEYINCPLKFALHHIYGLNDETDKGDYMDSGTMGTIVHDTLQELYYPNGTEGSCRVDKERIKSFSSNLDKVITRQINKTYMHLPDSELDAELTGDSKIQKVTIQLLVENVINYDLKLLDEANETFIEVIECESTHNVRINANGTEFKFQFRADRIDRIGGKGPIRIVDYKTGKEEATSFSCVASLFDRNKGSKRPKAIVQLILYCLAWQIDNPAYKGDILPYIYKLQNMDESGVKFGPMRQNKKQISLTLLKEVSTETKTSLLEEFYKELGSELRFLFDQEAKFTQAPSSHNQPCSHCRFSSICKRQIPESN